MISLNNIYVRYAKTTVVRNFSASANAGEFIALVGPNGSGKSSLIKAVTGLIPHQGSTTLPIASKSRAKTIAYLAQNATAPDYRLVKDIVSLGRSPYTGRLGRQSETDRTIIQDAMARCNITDFSNRPYGSLSGGQQTRVHLARALATDCPIMLADEPVTALDPYYQLSVMQILRETANRGAIVITALHDLALAQKFCDKVWVMKAGELIANGPAKSSLTDDILRNVFRITADGEIAT